MRCEFSGHEAISFLTTAIETLRADQSQENVGRQYEVYIKRSRLGSPPNFVTVRVIWSSGVDTKLALLAIENLTKKFYDVDDIIVFIVKRQKNPAPTLPDPTA